MAAVLGKERKGICLKKKSFLTKKHETERRTALTHYLGQITEKQMYDSVLRVQCFVSTLFAFDRFPVLKLSLYVWHKQITAWLARLCDFYYALVVKLVHKNRTHSPTMQ